MDRRTFLASAGTLALTGCLGETGGGATGGGERATAANADADGTADGGTTTDANALENHPGAAGLADQPTLGPDPFDADAVVVAFEDPSCPNCRRFETTTFPEIRSKWTENGKASFVFRGFPVTYPWGKPATQALETTYARDADAFWALKDRYFAEQSSFDESNVLDRTEAFLADNTDVDAAAVVREAREEERDDAVRADLRAGRDAGFSATPSFLLFHDGALVTSLTGPKSFTVFERALRL